MTTRTEVAELRKKAARDDPDAVDWLAMYTRDGLRDASGQVLIRRNAKEAARLFRRAARLGNTDAMNCYAVLLEEADPEANFAEARRWYLRAFRSGGHSGAHNLATSYQHRGEYTKAVRWFRRAAALDDSALLPLAEAELSGVGTRRNVPAALSKLEHVARGGGVCELDREFAMLTLFRVHYEGWLVKRDYETAVGWLRRAASLGSAAARGLLEDLDG